MDYQENKAYQLAALEQQNRLCDSLDELNRSLLANREEQHADVEEVSLQVDGLREDLNRLFIDSFRGAQRSELILVFIIRDVSSLRNPNLRSKRRRGWEDGRPVDLEGCTPLDRGADRLILRILHLQAKTRLRLRSIQIIIGTQNLSYQFEVATLQLLHIREDRASPPEWLWDNHEPQPIPTIFAPGRDNGQAKGLLG